MNCSLSLRVFIALLSFCFVGTAECRGADKMLYAFAAHSSGPLEVAVDSALVRPGLVRIYCRLLGRPHTSQRIDGVSIRRNDSLMSEATDIDGVDFRRWFQWEDNGVIPVEIDFAALTSLKQDQVMKFSTPRGLVEVTFRLTPRAPEPLKK